MTSNFRTKLKARKPTTFAKMAFTHDDGSVDQRVIIKPTHADKQAIIQGAVNAGEIDGKGKALGGSLEMEGFAARIVARLLYVDGERAFGDSSEEREDMLSMPDYEDVVVVAMKAFTGEGVEEVKANFPAPEAGNPAAEG